MLCTSGNVDVVDTCSCTSDCLKAISVSKKLGANFSSGSNDKSVEALDVLVDLFLLMTEILFYFVSLILQVLNRLLCNALSD